MTFSEALGRRAPLLLEGALGERLKREYGLTPDDDVALGAFVYDERGRAALRALWREYGAIARQYGFVFCATTPTRRVNRERARRSRYPESIARDNMRFLLEIKAEYPGEMFAGALLGCKGDAYRATEVLAPAEALRFHRWAAREFCAAGADFLLAGIMPALPEALGMARAMAETGLPAIVSFMIRRDGRLIDGTPIAAAISAIDREAPPTGYMANCVHPAVLLEALKQPCNRDDGQTRARFLGLQANTSPLSPEELDACAEIVGAEPEDWAEDMLRLAEELDLRLMGGCCGTDGRHIRALAKRLAQDQE